MILYLEGNDQDQEAAQALLQEHGFNVSLRSGDIPATDVFSNTTEEDLPLAFLEHSIDGIVILDVETVGAIYANSAFAEILGYSLEEVRRLKVWDWQADWSRAEIEQIYAMRNWPAERFETRHRRKDGQVLDVDVSHKAIFWGGKEVVLCVVKDISERKAAEEALLESEQRYREIYETSSECIFLVDVTAHGRFRYAGCNPAGEKITGLLSTETSGKFVEEIFPEELASEISANFHRCLGAGTSINYEEQINMPAGKRFFNTTLIPVRNFADDIYRIIGIARDITKSRRTHEALENRLLALTRPLDDAAGVSFEELFNTADIQRLQDDFARATGVASIITLPDGTPLTEPSNFCRLCEIIRTTEKGTIKCMKSDAELGRHSLVGPTIHECLSAGLWGAGAAISVGGRHIANWLIGQVRDESITEERMRAYARQVDADEEAVVESFLEVPIMSREQFGQIARALYTLAQQLSSIAFQNVQQARFITDYKRAEEALRKSELKYRSIVEHAPFGISRSTREGKLLSVNPALASILKYDSVQELQESINRSSIQEVLFPKPSEREPLVEQIFSNDSWHVFNNRLRCKDGSLVTCRVHSRPILGKDGQASAFESYQENITDQLEAEQALRESEEKFRVLAETSPVAICIYQGERFIYTNPAMERLFGFDTEELCGMKILDGVHEDYKELVRSRAIARLAGESVPCQYEIKCVTKNGEELYVLLSAGRMEHQGRPTGVASFLDITERKRSEELIRASLLEKEVLLKEIHHRVKNNLQVVSSLLFLQAQKFSDPELQNCFLESQSRICSMALAHEQLYQSKNLAEISVKTYVENLVGQLEQVFLSPGQEIDCRLAVEDLSLDIEKVVPCGLLITELLSNVYKHAFADGRSGQVTISLQRSVEQIELAVADDGVGLPAEFDFLQTKTLGLQLVSALVNELGGILNLERGQGTRFGVRCAG